MSESMSQIHHEFIKYIKGNLGVDVKELLENAYLSK